MRLRVLPTIAVLTILGTGHALAQAAAPVAVALPHDLSVMGMFEQADNIVKAVMLILLAAAIATWIIWLAKWLELAAARQNLKSAQALLAGAPTLDAASSLLAVRRGHAAHLVLASAEEVRLSQDHSLAIGSEGLKERVHSRLARLQNGFGRKLQRSVGILATIGSTAPFVGLFGTVWGIMNAFIGIAETQTTNLAVVAPGIAEALLATALGLVAAIPAVVFYNALSRGVAAYKQNLADLSATIERLVSRDRDALVSAAVNNGSLG